MSKSTPVAKPEQARLMDRLFNDPSRTLVNFKLFRGDGEFTAEQLCAEINKAMDQSESRKAAGDFGDGPTLSGKPPVNVRDLVATIDNEPRCDCGWLFEICVMPHCETGSVDAARDANQ